MRILGLIFLVWITGTVLFSALGLLTQYTTGSHDAGLLMSGIGNGLWCFFGTVWVLTSQ